MTRPVEPTIRCPSPIVFLPVLFLWALLIFIDPQHVSAQMEFYWSSGLSLSQEYDDNINLTENNTVSDYITLITESVSLGLRTEDFDSSIDFSLGYSFYQEHDENNSFRTNIDFSNFKEFPLYENLILDLDGSINLSEDPAEANELVATDRTGRNRYLRGRFSARITYQFGEEDTLYGGFANTLLENSDPEIEDSWENRPFLGLSYWFNQHHGLTARASHATAEFDVTSNYDETTSSASYIWRFREATAATIAYSGTSMDFADAGEPDYRTRNMTFGLSHRFSDSFLASANVGIYNRNEDGIDEETGLSWSATLTKDYEMFSFSANGGYFQQNPDNFSIDREFSGSLSMRGQFDYSSFSITGNHSYTEQFFEAENLGFTKQDSLSGTYSMQPLEDLSIGITALYRKNDYVELDIPRTDNLWQIGTSFSYRIFEWLTASFNISHREQDSDLPENSYKGNRVFFSLSYPYEGRPIEF